MDYVIRSNGSKEGDEFVGLFHKLENEYNSAERHWIQELRGMGISAAHPDDGWVNREINEMFFCYPQFKDNVEIGSLVALGDHEKFRIVRIIGHRKSMFGMDYWRFEEAK